jgi:hypothetical protein
LALGIRSQPALSNCARQCVALWQTRLAKAGTPASWRPGNPFPHFYRECAAICHFFAWDCRHPVVGRVSNGRGSVVEAQVQLTLQFRGGPRRRDTLEKTSGYVGTGSYSIPTKYGTRQTQALQIVDADASVAGGRAKLKCYQQYVRTGCTDVTHHT